MNKCIVCGNELKPNVKFCAHCGAKQEEQIVPLSTPNVVNQSGRSCEKAKEIVSKITDSKVKMAFHPLLSEFSHGFKAFFVGNPGSKKEDALTMLREILYNTGKIKENKIEWLSFSEIPTDFSPEKLYVIGDLQTAVNQLFNLDDYSSEGVGEQRKYQDLMDLLVHVPISSYVVLDGTKVEKTGFITLDPRLSFVFHTVIEFPELSDLEIYDCFISYLPKHYKERCDDSFKEDFTNYLKRNRKHYPFNNKELSSYLASECVQNGNLILPEERYQTKSLDALFNNIIGMEDVKKKLLELNQYLSVRVELEKRGAVLPSFNLNMMFLGNPGVGKTTIARIISKILFDLGYIREEKLIECTSKDLVSSYAGLTGVKTNKVISRAMGGVLFIDEAYALARSCGQAGAESIAILVKAMEDFKGEFVVMFAGYTNEMDDFVKSNSGIESRISYNFSFPDYTTDELLDIFMLKLGKTHLSIDNEGKDAARNILKFVAGKRNFGNGRFVDKMIQATLTKHSTLGLTGDDLMTIRKESIPKIEEIMRSIK